MKNKEISGRLFRLAAPLILQNIINQSLALIDTFMVGALGENELSAVTLANTPLFVVMLIIFGIASGTCILVGQYWGKGDKDTINRVLGVGLLTGGGFSFIVMLAFLFFPEQILSITSSKQELVEIGAAYARIVCVSYFFNSLTLVYLNAQRSMENPRVGMVVLMISTGLNTLLNYMFIFGKLGAPKLGVEGAAIATVISRAAELLIVVVFAMGTSSFRLKPRLLFRPGRIIIRDFFRFTLPVVMNEGLWSLGISIFPVIIGHMEDSVSGLAAYSVAGSIERVVSAFYFGIGQAVGIILGMRLGSGLVDGIYEMSKRLIKIAAAAGGLCGVCIAVLSRTVIKWYVFPVFELTPETQDLAVSMLTVVSVAAMAKAMNFTTVVGVLRCGGDVKVSMIIEFISLFALAIPMAAVVGLSLKWSVLAVYAVMCGEEIWKMIGIGLRYRSKKWIVNVTREAV